jgi:hypothetical protein
MINRTYFARYRTGNNNGNYQEGSCLVTVKSLFPNPCKGFEKACENFKTKLNGEPFIIDMFARVE